MRPFTRAARTITKSQAAFPRIPRKVGARPTTTWIHTSPQSRVRVRQPWLNWRTVGLWSFYITVSTIVVEHLLDKLVDGLELGEDEDEANQEEEDNTSTEEEDTTDETFVLNFEDDDDEGAMFLPVQAPKQLPRHSYHRSDPEWQEFVKLNRNRQRQTAVRRDLAERLTHAASSHPILRPKLGKDIKWSKLWLDFVYPDKAAPEYIRRGWALVEDDTVWSKQIIPHSQYIQLRHIMWPKAVFIAFKTCFQTLYDLQVIRVKEAFGMELAPKQKQLQLFKKLQSMQQKAMVKLPGAQAQIEKPTPEVERRRGLQGQPLQRPQIQGDELGKSNAKDAAQVDPPPKGPRQIPLPKAMQVVAVDVFVAFSTSLNAFVQAWKVSKMDPMPPGCCFLVGDVELTGSQGRCKMGVHAAYDPKASDFVWMESKAKGIWAKNQAAKGSS